MNEHPKSDADSDTAETPMARALRLKKAAAQAKSQPHGGKIQRKQTAAMPAGASKPWMKK